MRPATAFCCAALCLIPALARAQLLPVENQAALAARVGRGVLLTLPDDVERVALADDKIARPQVISAREVLLTGLVPGRTTVFVWLVDGTRRRYPLHVERDLDVLVRAVRDLDPGIVIEASADGSSVLLRGEVADRRTAGEAVHRATRLLQGQGVEVLDLLRFPGYAVTVEEQLTQALAAIDLRIRVRRIQTGDAPDADRDSFVLEGRVRDLQALVQAVTLAERQLGGTGTELKAANDQQLQHQRTRGFFGSLGIGGGGQQFLQGSTPPPAGLAAQVARGLVLTSESGRVISLLEVDELHQVLVSIRVIEVNRTKARKAGIDWRFTNDNVSVSSSLIPRSTTAGGGDGESVGNIVASWMGRETSVLAAIDFLEDKSLARAVAEPNVLTLSGEPATVIVGGEVPIPSTAVTQVTTVQGFFFQDFGVRLDIRPTVVGDDMIALEVSPSIIRRSTAIGVGDVPGFQVQSVQTTARVQAGQSLVLGGLLSFEEGLEQRKIPGFGWLPGLGRWRRNSRDETELLFVILPRIVEAPKDDVPPPPVAMDDLDALEVPELEWPEERRRWRDEFEPRELRPDGVPPEFLPELEAEPEQVPPPDEAAPAEAEEAAAEVEEPELVWDEPEPAAVEAPPAAPTPVLATVDVDTCLHLRPEPGMWREPADCVAPDVVVEILGESGDWRQVRLPDGREGWMAGDYLRPLAAEDQEGLEEQLRRLQEELERLKASG